MKVSIRIFDKDEQTFLSTVVGQAAKRLQLELAFTDAGNADVVFVKEDEPGASVFANSCSTRPRPIAVVYGGNGYPWCLERPATTKSLVSLLPLICAKLPGDLPVPVEEATGDVASSAALPPLLPVQRGFRFLRDARKAAEGATAWRCSIAGETDLLINAADGTVFYPESHSWRTRDLIQNALRADSATFTPLDAATLAAMAAQMHSTSLEGFLWLAAQEAEPEPLHALAESVLNRKFKLTRWPSFSRFEHSSLHIALSGRLMKQPLSLRDLLGMTDCPSTEAVRFYNSACMCGLVQMEEPVTSATSRTVVAMPSAPAREEKAGVFSRILRRFAG